MNKYKFEGKQILSAVSKPGYQQVDAFMDDYIFYPYSGKNKDGIHIISHPDFFSDHTKTLSRMLMTEREALNPISHEKVIAVNTLHPSEISPLKKTYKMHVLGLGDVGGMMLSALRLVGGESLSEIGIFDLDEHKVQRWLYELNQIKTMDRGPFPPVKAVDFDDVFDCDIFVFTASTLIPEVGSGIKDVRMFQLEANAKIIKIYAKKAAEVGFKGQFIVVSDPVDLLCKAVLDYGEGKLLPEQIKGFGLGVMHARACFYSKSIGADYYESQGRAYGPHGKHLIIADHIKKYDHEKSLKLTEKTIKANLDIRSVGYKPFIAPAFSSAALSILAYLQGKEHYSTVYVDEVFFGCKNRAVALNLFDVEQNVLSPVLLERLKNTYEELRRFDF